MKYPERLLNQYYWVKVNRDSHAVHCMEMAEQGAWNSKERLDEVRQGLPMQHERSK